MTKEYYEKNKKHMNEKMKEWRKNNPDYDREYKKRNKEKMINYMKNYIYDYKKYKYHNDPIYKLRENLRVRFWHTIKNGLKIKSMSELLGCTIEECKQHLEKQFKPDMTWDNHGKIWEIDHIKSCSKFDLTKLEQQKQCFHYTNLQPLYKLENRQKSNK